MDSESLRPVLIGMTLFLVLGKLKPKNKTNIEIVDDAFVIIDRQQDKLMAGVVLVGALIFAANYINQNVL
jgi:hypothetical protein